MNFVLSIVKHLPAVGAIAYALAALATSPKDPQSWGTAAAVVIGTIWQKPKAQATATRR